MSGLRPRGWIDEPLYSEIRSLMPISTIDLLITHRNRLLLMLRKNEPAKDQWFVPGGRIFLDEALEDAVYRVLKDETGLKPLKVEQKGTMSHRWPEVHTVTTFYRVEVDNDDVRIDDQHSAFKWVTEAGEDLHPYLREMIDKSDLFS